jgi:hypothetical protein
MRHFFPGPSTENTQHTHAHLFLLLFNTLKLQNPAKTVMAIDLNVPHLDLNVPPYKVDEDALEILNADVGEGEADPVTGELHEDADQGGGNPSNEGVQQFDLNDEPVMLEEFGEGKFRNSDAS